MKNQIEASQQVALIGCGHWGRNLARNFARLGSLRWICDENQALLEAHAKLWPDVRLSCRFEEVLEDRKTQAVVIATPAGQHYRHAKQAILSGKDVFVEKPMTLRYREGLELVELAQSKGIILMVGHVLEYHPTIKLLKDLVHRGELGRILYIYSTRLNSGKVRRDENILWSFAPHDISVISSLVGIEPTVAIASGGAYLQAGIADATVTNLVFENGIRAHIFVSWLHPYKEQKLVVVGDRKMAVFNGTVCEHKLEIYERDIDGQSGLPVAGKISETTLLAEEKEPLSLECEHFLNCIQERRQPLTNGENALRVLKVLEASQMSLEKGGVPVRLADVGREISV